MQHPLMGMFFVYISRKPYDNAHMRTIYLGGGCFWCTEAVFQRLRGVLEVTPGYMGGETKSPSYQEVSTGTTGHAEVIKVVYDNELIQTDDIFDVFFASHDPTTPNRQEHDVGTQYRSVIFYTDEATRESAVQAIERAQMNLPLEKAIITHVIEAADFYPAESEHCNFYMTNRDAPYCLAIIDPKIEKLQKKFSDKVHPDR
jgi:methionine-S-sulfoxide reductase